MTCLGAGNGKSEGVRGVQFVMGLFGKTQERPPKELVRASDREAARWASELGAGRPRSQTGPYFRGLPLSLGTEGRV